MALVCCKKEIAPDEKRFDLVENISSFLIDSLSIRDRQNLEMGRMRLGTIQIGTVRYVRIPLKSMDAFSEFVYLELEGDSSFKSSKIFTIYKTQLTHKGSDVLFNGSITISALNRKTIIQSGIVDGYIEAFYPISNTIQSHRQNSFPDPNRQQVIVSGDALQILNLSAWFNIWGTGGGADGQGTYASLQIPQGYDSGGGAADVKPDNTIVVDFEPPAENLESIDILKYLKCFESIPDDGATCSIEILTDIPVDDNPNKLFSWENGSPGHAFLQIKKTNGNKTIQQNIGFYPVSGWKTLLTSAPVKGKFVDNGSHEFNAGFIENISPKELSSALSHINYLAKFIRYDIDEFNCTDFALEVFNHVRISNPLEIPKYDLPGGTAPLGSSTPQGVYNKLKSMKQSGVEGGNINIPGVKGWVSDSHGPCK